MKSIIKNRISSLRWTIILCILLSFNGTVEADIPAANIQNALVTIYTTNNSVDELYQGTGFIVDPDGIIATNFHVVFQKFRDNNTPLLVMLRNGAFHGRILSFDTEHDVALIKIETNNLQQIEIEERKKLKLGEGITIIGSSSGYNFETSNGNIMNIFGMNELLQITTPVYPGYSGGPVLNSEGKVIGILTFYIDDDEKLNFAVPISYVVRLLNKQIH